MTRALAFCLVLLVPSCGQKWAVQSTTPRDTTFSAVYRLYRKAYDVAVKEGLVGEGDRRMWQTGAKMLYDAQVALDTGEGPTLLQLVTYLQGFLAGLEQRAPDADWRTLRTALALITILAEES